MSIYYYAINPKGEYLFDNFPSFYHQLITDYKESSEPFQVTVDGKVSKARIGRKINDHGTIYVLTTESQYIKRNKLFKELLNQSILPLQSFSSIHENLLNSQNAKIEELIHNITSLNTYSIQDLFALIPQKLLSENINKQKEIVRGVITEKPNITVDTFLKLIKYNLAMKVEFSVFERTQEPIVTTKKNVSFNKKCGSIYPSNFYRRF